METDPETSPSSPIKQSEAVMAYYVDLIENSLPPHGRLPPERQVAEEFDVARLTVRRLLDRLEQEGRVYRIQGSGTFVSPPMISKTLEFASFSEDMRARGLRPGATGVTLTREAAGPTVGSFLGLSPAAEVLHVFRVRTANMEPICLEDAYLSATSFGDLTEAELVGSLYATLQDRYGLTIVYADQRVHATVLSEDAAKLLTAAPHSAALAVERTVYDMRRRPVEYTRSLYRGDRYSYAMSLKRSV